MKTQKGATLVGSLVSITILATTLVSVLNLQTSIIRAKFFLQYDNTANLLVAEGLEIVRAIYANNGTVSDGKYRVDYNTTSLSLSSTCRDFVLGQNPGIGLNPSCHLYEPVGDEGYTVRISPEWTSKEFHRFVSITNSSTVPKVTSNVIVCNFRINACREYVATIELYKIN